MCVLYTPLHERDMCNTFQFKFQILPCNIVSQLLSNQSVKAEQYDMVSILCSDVVDFTAICGSPAVKPIDVVHMCNKMYTYFDTLVNINNVYKVRTFRARGKDGDPHDVHCILKNV